jgi:hypothetical protein
MMIKIENRGKNLWNINDLIPINFSYGRIYKIDTYYVDFLELTQNRIAFQSKDFNYAGFGIILQGVKGKTINIQAKLAKKFANSGRILVMTRQIDEENQSISGSTDPYPYTLNELLEGETTTVKISNISHNYIIIAIAGEIKYFGGIVENIQVEINDTATEYEPPKQDKIELNTELFGYAGVFDEYLGNGKVLRRWKKVDKGVAKYSRLTNNKTNVYEIQSIPYSDALQQYNNALILKPDGLPLPQVTDYNLDAEHWYYYYVTDKFLLFIDKATIDNYTGSTTEQKAENYINDCTIIYQLATPVIEDINVSGELNLYPGDNHIIIEDVSVLEISGRPKYMNG